MNNPNLFLLRFYLALVSCHLKLLLLCLPVAILALSSPIPYQQKKELSVFNCVLPTKGKHFYSSSESEEEEESHKKFNIKIKPLQSKDVLKNAATVDELKASIGNIALSPSPVVSGVLPLSFGEVGQRAMFSCMC